MIAKNTKSTRRQILASATCGVFILAGLVMSASLFGSNSDTVHAQVPPETGAKGFPCSNRTLTGRYGMKGEGLVPSGPPPAQLVPFCDGWHSDPRR